MHHQIQNLKGNIRVYCRVKPLTGSSQFQLELRKSSTNQNCINFPSTLNNEFPTSLEVQPSAPGNEGGGTKLFHFDNVFPPHTRQEDIFTEVKPFIQSAIDGENVCIFAYG
jgi:kinesin family member C1